MTSIRNNKKKKKLRLKKMQKKISKLNQVILYQFKQTLNKTNKKKDCWI